MSTSGPGELHGAAGRPAEHEVAADGPVRGFGHGSVDGLPLPIEPGHGVVLGQTRSPQVAEEPGSLLFLEPAVCRAAVAQLAGNGVPLDAGSRHVCAQGTGGKANHPGAGAGVRGRIGGRASDTARAVIDDTTEDALRELGDKVVPLSIERAVERSSFVGHA